MIKDKGIVIKNIYYMLSYAYMDIRPDRLDDISTEEFDHIHDLFAALLAEGMALQVKRGLHREYRSLSGSLPSLRGKINMPRTIEHRFSRRQLIGCEFDELSEDNPFNRILKTTALVLLRHGEVSAAHHDALKKVMPYYSGMSEVDPLSIDWASIRFTRATLEYRPLLSVCRLVLDGLLLTTESGEIRLMAHLKPESMERLYEKFILRYYEVEWPALAVGSPQINWALDDDESAMLPVMQSDIMLSAGARRLIIDAKYYAHTMQANWGVNKIYSDNLYQIFAYVKNEDAGLSRLGIDHEVSGLLLYAQTDEEIQPDVSYRMSGNRIGVKTLDLNCPFDVLRKQLDGIAESHFPSTAAAA